MKLSSFIIFVSIVILIYGLTNFYIFYRGLNAFPIGNSARTYYIILFWSFASCFILSRFIERAFSGIVIDAMIWIGSVWLAIMLYSFIYILAIDAGRLVLWISRIPFLPATDPLKLRMIFFYSGIIIISLVVVAGFINARSQKRTVLNISIPKKTEGKQDLKIAMASDIHLGTLIGTRGAKRLVRMLNDIHPDIILLAGDVVDEDLMPVIRQNLGERLTDLKAPLGVYAITGNHEYIGGAEKAVVYLEAHGIKFLRDSVIIVDNRFYLAGREDRDRPRFSGKERKDVESLLEGIDRSLPIIMMDHQPFSLEKAVEQGVDLQLSGHTHHGQLWPLNYITNAIYEISQGYRKIGKTNFYVSPGFGSWGPPVRLGNRPEVIEINVKFGK